MTVRESTLELTVEMLEALDPSAESYPATRLGRSGRVERREFQALRLENDLLYADLLPDLGGRIIRIWDKRTQSEILPFDGSLLLRDSGPRGVECLSGFQVVTNWQSRLHSMATSMWTFDRDDSGEPIGVWWSDLGAGISLNCLVSIADDSARIQIEVRAFNRTLRPLHYNGGLRIGIPDARWMRNADQEFIVSGGTAIHFDPSEPFSFAEVGEDSAAIYRFDHLRSLAPHQVDAWQVQITPYSGLPNICAANSECAIGWTESELVVRSASPNPPGKVVIQLANDQVLEAPAQLTPQVPDTFDLSRMGSQTVGCAVLDGGKRLLMKVGSAPEPWLPDRKPDETLPNYIGSESGSSEVGEARFDVSQRHLAYYLQGLQAMRRQSWLEAASHFESSLLYNGDDHLAWLLKGICDRKIDSTESEPAALLNAHFLAPMEPALRMDTLISSQIGMDDFSRLLEPLASTPEALIDVACLLLSAGLLPEATSWMEAASRIEPMPMLEYLAAYAFANGGLDSEAGARMERAAKLGTRPPNPWRTEERISLEFLANRFPQDRGVRSVLETLETFQPS